MTTAIVESENPRRRGGYIVAEAMVMLVLSVLVGGVMCGALISQARLARSTAERIAQNDAVRATLHILPVELRALDPARDVRGFSGDSISARWVRASGAVCRAGDTNLWVRLSGMRMVDPSKDSMIIASAGTEHAVALDDAVSDAGACPQRSGEIVYRVRSPDPGVRGGAALVFESGTYYLTQRALRYRVGAEGRQPLTEELLRDAGTTMTMTGSSATAPATLRLNLQLRPSLQFQSSRSATLATPFPNTRPP